MTSTLIFTASPNFVDMAKSEFHQAQPDVHFLAELAPGVWSVQTSVLFMPLAEQWRKAPPVFIRHICPAHVTVPLPGTGRDVSLLERAIKQEFLELIDPDLPFSVQTRLFGSVPYKPFDVNSTLSDIIQKITRAPLNVRAPVQILSVVVGEGIAHLGLSLANHNLSDWAGGVHRFARQKGQIGRAEFKLLEALHVFGIELPPRGIVLDLGAAPGGWTRVLRQQEQYVTAVDPADLHPSLKADTKVRHKRMSAEAYLAEDPDTFDIIVNDMRQDARDSARLMVKYAHCLYPHGMGLMTFKLPESGRAVVLDHAFNILRDSYQIAGARQLFHNRSEITVFLRRPSD
jgi:23S rRNA (cytidine2498-2'-O)-methyltransferase